MEDEARALPHGWVRSWDEQNQHQFFVDTTQDPPVSIWEHPHDNEAYLNALSSEERERIEQDKVNRAHDDFIHSLSDMDDDDDHRFSSAPASSPPSSSQANPQLPPRPDGKGKTPGTDNRTFGRKLKDKMTGMSHEQREDLRRQRYAEEQRMYETHMRVREAMQRAMQTGQPQLVGKDRDGKDVYIEPPQPYDGYGTGYGGGYPYGRGYGYSPYQNGIYTTPNARYIRPQGAYGRPGAGMTMPLALGGGLLGGALLGSLMF